MAELLEMFRAVQFSPPTQLTEAVAKTVNVIPVADIAFFSDGPGIATIGDDLNAEIIRYEGKQDNMLTGVTRGHENTVPRDWAKGDPIARCYTAGDHDGIVDNIGRLNEAKAERAASPVDGNLLRSDVNGNPVVTAIPAADVAKKVPSPVAGNLVSQAADGSIIDSGASVATLTRGELCRVPCTSVYNAETHVHALTKKIAEQVTGMQFDVVFVPDHDFVAGDVLTLDGETFDVAYDNWDGAVINGAWRAGVPVTMTLEKDGA